MAGLSFRNNIISGPVGQQILLHDPAGNLIELFAPPTDRPQKGSSIPFDRREFLTGSGLAVAAAAGVGSAATACSGPSRPSPPDGKPDYTVHIGTGLVELAPDRVVSTTTYNGQFPGPLMRFKRGSNHLSTFITTPTRLNNCTGTARKLPVDVDGAAEEGTPYIPAHGMRRISFMPGPAGFRFYHTHIARERHLFRGQYSGQVGPVYIEPKQNPGGLRSGSLPHAQGI